ncbi:MAG: ISL3 family transposase [Steroidobacteraceae bacterium]
MVTEKIFEAALGIGSPWFIAGMNFEANQRKLNIRVDFEVGSRFAVPEQSGEHPVHDTVTKTYRHLNFFQHECELAVRVPRVKLPDGKVVQVTPPWAGKLSGFSLLFEAFVLLLARESTFSGAARISGLSVHRVMALCERYVDEAVSAADLSEVKRVALDETSRAKGHDYVTLFADADPDPARRRVLFVAEGKEATTVEAFAANLRAHRGKPSEIGSISIDMSPAFIKGVTEHFPNAQITFDKFHVIAHASEAIDKMRRLEQKRDPSLKGLRWVLLKDRSKLTAAQRAELDGLLAHMTTTRTARAWHYREQLRDILTRKQPNVVHLLLNRWCSNVLRSKVEPMKEVAEMIRSHLDGIRAWVTSRQTNGFLEAINGLFQAAKRKARGYGRFRTIRMIIFLIAGKLDFSRINPYVAA